MSERSRLAKKIFVHGTVECLSGLHLGAPPVGLAAGAADALVVRAARDGKPYLPASTLRGKLRFLVEQVDDAVPLFGAAGGRRGTAGRLVVRDGELLDADAVARLPGVELPWTELKTEAAIDRVTAAASPRQIERVPAGAKFSLGAVLTIFEGDDEPALVAQLWRAFALLEDDYLGAHGGRGYGQVRVQITELVQKDRDAYLTDAPAQPYAGEVPARLRRA